VSQLRVRRWQKGRHDRLYLNLPGGVKVGYFDLSAERLVLDRPEHRAAAEAAVSSWRASVSGDLAGRRPGAALLDRAAQAGPRSRTVRVLARAAGVRTRDRSWRIGAKGEAAVGRRLDRLERSGWRVLHNVVLGGRGDVDHLLIGPAGVVVVNTKHHPRAQVKVGRDVVFVRGEPRHYPRSSHREADRVAAALREATGRAVNVAPMLVFHGHAGRIRGWWWRRPLGVQVVPSRWVRSWLRLPGRRVLSAAEVEDLFRVAREASTWEHA